MTLTFSWDPIKSVRNRRKHGVGFLEAATAFGDPLSITVADPLHSHDDSRFVLIGLSAQGRLVVVVHAEHGGGIRLVSARQATRAERRRYEQ